MGDIPWAELTDVEKTKGGKGKVYSLPTTQSQFNPLSDNLADVQNEKMEAEYRRSRHQRWSEGKLCRTARARWVDRATGDLS